jgi:uncharacterized protein YukE
MPNNRALILIATGILLSAQACTREADSESAKQDVTLGDLKTSFTRLTDEIAAYTFDQRDEAVKTARKELEEIDAKIDELAKNAEIESQELTSDVRKQQAKLMRELKARRAQISEMTERLNRSSAGAWNEIRDGLANAYGEIGQALDNARAEFAESDTENSGKTGP